MNAPAGSLDTWGITFERNHGTANFHLHAQLCIRPSIVVKFYQIPTSGVGEVTFTRFQMDRHTDRQIGATLNVLPFHGGA